METKNYNTTNSVASTNTASDAKTYNYNDKVKIITDNSDSLVFIAKIVTIFIGASLVVSIFFTQETYLIVPVFTAAGVIGGIFAVFVSSKFRKSKDTFNSSQ